MSTFQVCPQTLEVCQPIPMAKGQREERRSRGSRPGERQELGRVMEWYCRQGTGEVRKGLLELG